VLKGRGNDRICLQYTASLIPLTRPMPQLRRGMLRPLVRSKTLSQRNKKLITRQGFTGGYVDLHHDGLRGRF
jgi:hypothetical protein